MGTGFIWLKIKVLMCLLLTRLISKDYRVIKSKTIKWVLTLVCVILHSGVPRRLMCIYCVSWQLHLIKVAWLDFDTALLRHQPAFSLCLLCLLFTFKTFYFDFCTLDMEKN